MSDKSLLSSLTADLAVKQAEVSRIANAFPVDDQGRFSISTEMYADYKKAVGAAKEVKSLVDDATAAADIERFLSEPTGPSVAGFDAGQRQAVDTEVKDLGSMFLESDAYRSARDSGFRDRPYIRAGMEGKSLFSLSGGTVTHQALGQADNRGIYEREMRKWHIRDLFPKSSTSAAVLYGVRETGWVNNAAQVKQRYANDNGDPATGTDSDVFGRAPRSKLTLTPVLIPIVEVAHLLDAHKNILADEPRLRTLINTRLVDGVKYAEDYDLLYSVGDGEKMTGLFNVPGVQSYTGLSADQYDVQVRRSITKAMLAEYDPTGLVISPTMWENLEVEEGTDGHLRIATAVAVGAQKRIWRLNVVATTAMADSTFLVGAFGMGAQLHDRESVNVQVSSENADAFERGFVTFRAEERVALEVVRPESFVIGSWTTPV